MPRTNWKRFRPNSLRAAIEGCVNFARERHNRSIDQIAELMGMPAKWTLYKWIESAKIPAVQIRTFEHACGASFVTVFLGASANMLVIDIPTGKRPTNEDLLDLNQVCIEACQQLMRFYNNEAPADEVLSTVNVALERLAFERQNVAETKQPRLDFGAEA